MLQVIFTLPHIAEFHLLRKILTGIKVSGFSQYQVQLSGITGSRCALFGGLLHG